MIMITARVKVHADKRDEALAAAATASGATTAEPGCLEYSFWSSVDDPNSMLLLERWEDDAALTTHMSSPNLAAFIEAIGPTVDGGMDVIRHDVESFGPLF